MSLLHLLGIIIRYCILLPIRACYFFIAIIISSILMFLLRLIPIPRNIKNNINFVLFHLCAKCAAASATTIINLHGKLPKH